MLSAALDAGTGGQKSEYVSASGSGGFGQSNENPINSAEPPAEITIPLKPPPTGGAQPANVKGPPKGPNPQAPQ